MSNNNKNIISIIMMMMMILLLMMIFLIDFSIQHGRMLEPPSRNSMWRAGFNTKPDYDDSELFCGGIMDQWRNNKGKCGICGDSYSIKPPRPYETGGMYASNITVRVYRPGTEIDVIIDLVANHMGTFEFSLCPRNDTNQRETEECFIPLKVNGSDKYHLKSKRKGIFTMPVELPRDIICEYCVFRWHWKSANNWGLCPDGKEAVGCGPQETYRNCADLTISYDHGIRGMNFQNYPSNSIGKHPNEFDRIMVMPEIPKDDFITFHPVQWPTKNQTKHNKDQEDEDRDGEDHHHNNHHLHHHHHHHHHNDQDHDHYQNSHQLPHQHQQYHHHHHQHQKSPYFIIGKPPMESDGKTANTTTTTTTTTTTPTPTPSLKLNITEPSPASSSSSPASASSSSSPSTTTLSPTVFLSSTSSTLNISDSSSMSSSSSSMSSLDAEPVTLTTLIPPEELDEENISSSSSSTTTTPESIRSPAEEDEKEKEEDKEEEDGEDEEEGDDEEAKRSTNSI